MNYTINLTAARTQIANRPARSAWDRGVTLYSIELVNHLMEAVEGGYVEPESLVNHKSLERALLNGARDWHNYSWGGCSLAYDADIAARMCAPWELRRTRFGDRRPNAREDWLDVQARALFQAAGLVWEAVRDCTTCTDEAEPDITARIAG